ncbi:MULTISPECIES: protein translocase subunit SecF [unclassified Wenzhouxiangella]|uniref:protein translocase subunit SecF n=1 Tax=unclassified Wenzhouxiangella TaxID=2613841 RepID=UPI000E328BED|nr:MULTISPECIES: protein translocase subunit SecF [unclassified Wenzhouxiangella]RFF27541.1 protein translocase subunit SecF [Wenzhouxiangella sp. 15181]RFP69597.1 protein translocase subunit SecF [Wenzhouxiangella sp. 15190]
MDIIKSDTKINFLRFSKVALVISALVLIAGIVSLSTRGLNFGLDFTGGTLIELHYPAAPEMNEVRQTLEQEGFEEFVVQTFGTASDIVIRIPVADDGESSADISTRVLEAVSEQTPDIEMRRVEFVGPQVGQELAEQGGLALLYVLIGVMIYISFRFQWRFAVGAVGALIHDVLLVVGVLSMFKVSFDLTVVAAILAVIGYSLNDTIVVYDRLRENFQTRRKGTPAELTNLSINQMLGRTLMTSLTTLLVLAALFYFGGEIIHAFAFTLIVGVIVGTYSSVYVAGSLAVKLGVSKMDLMPVQKEGADQPDQEILPERFRNREA